jgi:hypothetical protein
MKLRTPASRPAFTHDLDPEFAKIFAGFRHFHDALNLPGNLIDIVLGPEMFGIVPGELPLVEFVPFEQGEGVMIAGVPAEESRARGLSDEEAEQVKVEMPAGLEVRGVEAEVAKATNFERAIQDDSADVVFRRV